MIAVTEGTDSVEAVTDGSRQTLKDVTSDAACLGVPGLVPAQLDGAFPFSTGECIFQALESRIHVGGGIAALLQRESHPADIRRVHHSGLVRPRGIGATGFFEEVLDLVDAIAAPRLADAGEGCTHATIVPYASANTVHLKITKRT